MTDYCN